MLLDKKIPGKIARLEKTYDELRYAPISTVPVEMAETLEHFRGIPPEDSGLEWKPAESGDRWGDSWWTVWFRGQATVPQDFTGGKLFLRAVTGANECQLIVDSVPYGSFDSNHPVRLLDMQTKAGKTYCLHLEGYAGHTFPGTQPFEEPRTVAGGANADGAKSVGRKARAFDRIELVAEREDVSAFVFELRALRQLSEALDEHSLRRGRIQAALGKVFAAVYAKPADAAEEDWRAALAQAREIMRPLLALKNGPSTPTMAILGHSHIDTAWLWTVNETNRKLARTFSSVLSLMDQYPEFRFTQSAAYHSDVVKRLYPALFERMVERVREGRWEINGAMWIEPDCNIPSGESLVRQCLVGQRATREMFGVISDTLWQPDVFGYSAALPQILQGCGVRFFCTTKLGWNDTNHFPYDTFVWQGIDGSSVLSHFNRIHCSPDPETLIGAWKQVQHKDIQDRRLITYGYGDGGGGPTAEMIEIGRITADIEGCPKAVYQSITEFMEGVEKDLTPELPRWTGELYLELHRGTLTSVAPLKRGNRKSEFALRAAEFAATLARLRASAAYPSGTILDLWKTVLLNQFHDILPGSSIAEANDQGISELKACIAGAETVRNEALSALASGAGADAVLVASDLSWSWAGEIVLTGLPENKRPESAAAAQAITDVDGNPALVVSGITIPALGYAVLPLTDSPAADAASPFRVAGDTVETPYALVRFNDAGQIVSFYDKAARRELVEVGGAFNVFLLGEDVPNAWDNWDIDRDQRLKLAPQTDLISRAVVAEGPLQLRIRQEYRIGRNSTLTQDIIFHANSAQVDFDTAVEWREKYRFLKTEFAVDILTDSARHEIQFGHLSRSTTENTSFDRAQFDVCAHKWTDLSETGYGVAFLNDCKYACTVKGKSYRLSLLKSGRHPDPRGDEGRHRLSYALLPHTGGFSIESVVRPAYEFNTSVAAVPVGGSAGESFGLATVDSPNVIVEAVKWAEEGDAFILRLYEASRTGTHARLSFGLPVSEVSETNMLEEDAKPLTVDDNGVNLYFRPFEIKTLRCVAR